MTTTFRATPSGVNYSKIRNSRKDNKSLLDPSYPKEINKVSSTSNLNNDMQELSTDSIGKFQALESTMNQENLNYVNGLIKETEKNTQIRSKSISCKPGNVVKKGNPPVKVNINLNAEKVEETNPQKLFDNFFRFKNSQDTLINESSENQKHTFSGEKSQNNNENKLKKNGSESNASKETQSTKIHSGSNEFLKSIDEYLLSLTTNEKELGTAYFSMESEKKASKEILKENAILKNENKNLKQKLEKFEIKMKENLNAKRVFLQEYNMLKIKEEENMNLVKFLQQEILKMKNHIEGLKFKLKVTQESLVKEKIEAENSMIALKRVLFNNINESRIEDKIKRMFSKSRGKDEFEYVNSFEPNTMKNQDQSKIYNNFQQPSMPNETDESFVGKSIDSNIKSSYTQESFDDFNLYKINQQAKKNHYELEKKRKSMHSRYEYNPEATFINQEVSFNKNKAIPQKLKHSQAKEKYPPSFYNNNDTQFDEMSSFNDMQGNSLSMQNE